MQPWIGSKDLLKAKGVMLFALVDHSGEAEKAGMKMRPSKLLIFGSPKAGTPVMWLINAQPWTSGLAPHQQPSDY